MDVLDGRWSIKSDRPWYVFYVGIRRGFLVFYLVYWPFSFGFFGQPYLHLAVLTSFNAEVWGWDMGGDIGRVRKARC